MATECEPRDTTESCDANATESINSLRVLIKKGKVEVAPHFGSASKSWDNLIAPYQALLAATEGVGQFASDILISSDTQTECQAALEEAWGCVRSFLVSLSHQLPESRHGMLPLITTAQCRMDFFLKDVPCLKAFGLDCLGRLATYRAEIETDPETRNRWMTASERWYNEAKREATSTLSLDGQ
ncbi:hypothetical protein LX36DRAFT_378989 [Colletotrichum falcatum]|nr:hypothetical protein LX36DRAFT_378989 [Colletotrichum falcatum]